MTNTLRADRASYRNRGGILQRLISAYKARSLTSTGEGTVIKHNAEFHLSDNAILQIGRNCTIQDYAYFQLTMPYPKVIIADNVVIGRHCMITSKNLIKIGSNTLIGAFCQIIDTNHGIRLNQLVKDQLAEIGEVVIGDDVWIGGGRGY